MVHHPLNPVNVPATPGAAALANIDSFVAESGRGHVQYLKFNKGEFLFGLEENIVEPDERFAVNMHTLAKGFICWADGQVLGEEMVPVVSGRSLRKSDLEDFTDECGEWREQSSVEFTSLATGDVLLFKTSSHGGRNALATLAKAFSDRMKSGEATVVPVIEMHADSYRHKSYGKVHVPVFEIVDWLAPAGAGGDGDGDGDSGGGGGDHDDNRGAKGNVIDADDEADPFEEKPKRRGRPATKRTPV